MAIKIACLLIIFLNWGHCYEELDTKIKKLVDLNDKLNDNYNVVDAIKILNKVLDNWKFNPEELGLNQVEHIKSFGYPVEKHIVETEDGYLLTVIRIPYGVNQETQDKNRPVVYLQPGLYCSAACFIDVGSKRALGFLLADLGYDVWIANPRGTTYSRNHTVYDSLTSKMYWQFSWHEVGTIDIPNTIDYILAKTGQKQISYIGHSQGTTGLFVMLSEKPEYNKKITVAFALAPIAFMENLDPSNETYSTVRLVKFAKPLAIYLNVLKVYDLLPHSDPPVASLIEMCNYNTTDEDIPKCENLWNLVGDFNPEQNNVRDIGVILSHLPGGCSVKQLLHFSQLVNDGGFKKYDYGKRKNRKIYGQDEPPSYSLLNINIPIYLMYGNNDSLATPKDVKNLYKLLPTSTLFKVDYSDFRHGDFLYAKDVISLLYNYIFQLLDDYNKVGSR